MEAANGQKQQEFSSQTITDLDTTFIGEHEGQDVMSQSQISKAIQNLKMRMKAPKKTLR